MQGWIQKELLFTSQKMKKRHSIRWSGGREILCFEFFLQFFVAYFVLHSSLYFSCQFTLHAIDWAWNQVVLIWCPQHAGFLVKVVWPQHVTRVYYTIDGSPVCWWGQLQLLPFWLWCNVTLTVVSSTHYEPLLPMAAFIRSHQWPTVMHNPSLFSLSCPSLSLQFRKKFRNFSLWAHKIAVKRMKQITTHSEL